MEQRESSTFTVPIDVRSLHNNTYTLYLKCSDTTLNRTILFANTQTPTEYGYKVGNIGVSTGGDGHLTYGRVYFS